MRKYYLDNIRWITVVLVVIYHVIYMFNGVADAGVYGPISQFRGQEIIQYILYPWFMVLLFIVSGISARYALQQRTAKEFARSRTVKLLVPSTVGLLVFGWIQGYINMALSGALDQLSQAPGPVLYLIMSISGTGVLWYIQLLWVFSMVLLPVRKIEKGRLSELLEHCKGNPIVLALLVVAMWAAAQILNTPMITVYRFGIYGLAFFLGYYLFTVDAVMECVEKFRIPYAAAALVLGIAYCVADWGKNYAVSPSVNSPLAVGYLWFMCLAILGFMKRYGNRTSPFAAWMSRKSWGLYIFHYLPLSLCGLLLPAYTPLPPVAIYPVTTIAAFLGAYLLYEIISRIPLLRWCVLGIRKPKKEEQHVSG